MVKFYLTVRKDHPRQGKHNALQRLAYFSLPDRRRDRGRSRESRSGSRCSSRRSRTCSAATSGRATGTSWPCCCSSRSRSGTSSWCSRSIRTRCVSMITGGYNEERSPEERNARPFVHLLPAHEHAAARPRHRLPRQRLRRMSEPSRDRRVGRRTSPSESASTGAAFSWRAAARSARAVLAACDSKGPKSATRLLKFAERKNESLERALFRHTSMDVPLARARRAAGSHFPSYFISKHGARCGTRRRAACGDLQVGGMVKQPLQAHARRSRVASAHRLAPRPLLRRRLDRRRVAHRRAPRAISRDSPACSPARSTSTSSRSTTTITRAGTSTARCTRRRSSSTRRTGTTSIPAYGAPARVYSPVKLGYKNTKYLTRILFLPRRTAATGAIRATSGTAASERRARAYGLVSL